MSENETASGLALDSIFAVKAGMTRIFDEQGNHVPVTVVKLIPNVVSQVKTNEKDGYQSYQVAFQEKREKLVNNCKKGHLKKAGIDKTFNKFSEIATSEVDESFLGKEISIDNFTENSYVDVTGVSKGKGFQGVIKRYGFSGGPATHGSKFHRAPGSIGMSAYPARVIKQKKMPGQMGNKTQTVQNLKIVEVNVDQGYMLIKGSIPGSKNGFVRISKAIKKA